MKTPSKPTAKSSKKDELKTQADTDGISNLIKREGPSFLSKLKKKSIRVNNSWFRLISLDKRRFIEAVIQTVDKIQSSLLLKILTPLAEKLLRALGGIRGLIGNLEFGMQNFGCSLAKRVSLIAQKWGNTQAEKWSRDGGFIRFLAVIDMNDLPMFKVSGKIGVN